MIDLTAGSLIAMMLAACEPSDDYKMKPLGTTLEVPAAPQEPPLPPGYVKGKFVMARGFEFKTGGRKSYTMMSVKNEREQVWIGAQMPERMTALDCANAAAEAARKVGLKVSQRGAQLWFDGSNYASIFSFDGCTFETKR